MLYAVSADALQVFRLMLDTPAHEGVERGRAAVPGGHGGPQRRGGGGRGGAGRGEGGRTENGRGWGGGGGGGRRAAPPVRPGGRRGGGGSWRGGGYPPPGRPHRSIAACS